MFAKFLITGEHTAVTPYNPARNELSTSNAKCGIDPRSTPPLAGGCLSCQIQSITSVIFCKYIYNYNRKFYILNSRGA